MKIEAFVNDWHDEKDHAAATARLLAPYCEVTVLEPCSLSEQWESARRKFTGDIFFWCMSDVWPPIDLDRMFNVIRTLRADIGVYAPQVCWNSWQWDLESLPKIQESVYEVLNTEILCLAIRADVLASVPHVDIALHPTGVGIDLVVCTIAKRLGYKTVRDYRFIAAHPEGTSYNKEIATFEMERWFDSLNPEIAKAIRDTNTQSRIGVLTGNALTQFRMPEERLKKWIR